MIATLALLTRHGTAARRLDLARAVALHLTVGINAVGASGRFPRVQSPSGAGERFELQAFLLPASAGLAGAVEGAQPGVDSACVGFGAEFVRGCVAGGFGCAADFAGAVDGAVWSGKRVSDLFK